MTAGPARFVVVLTLAFLPGCDLFVADADREVYRLIEQRQRAALGETTEVRVADAANGFHSPKPYSFVPHPVTSEIPEEFMSVRPHSSTEFAPVEDDSVEEKTSPDDRESEQPDGAADQPTSQPAAANGSETQQEELYFGEPMTLAEVFAYAIKSAREMALLPYTSK